MKKLTISKISLYILILLSIFLTPSTIQADDSWTKEKNIVNLYFFHSDSCSHCKKEEKLLTKLEKNYTNLRIYRYEIHEERSKQILETAKNIYDIKTDGVPITIIGEEVYQGFHETKSKLTFIQTIEYYSKYAYQDKLGENIGITDLPFYKSETNQKTLKEFKKEYGNYTLIGNLKTKDLDTSLIATITGILSCFNPIYILSILGIILILKKYIVGKKDKILLLGIYFLANFLLTSTSIIKREFYTLIIQILLLLIFTFGFVKYYKNKKRQYASLNFLIMIAIIVHFFNGIYLDNYIKIFLNIKKIYLLEGLENISYHTNYLASIFFIQVLITALLTTITNKITTKYS